MGSRSTSLTAQVLQKLKRNFWGVLSFGYIVLCVLVTIFAYALVPDDSTNANQMHVSIHSKPPGFTVKMLTVPATVTEDSSWLHNLFFGKKDRDTEIPIASFHIEEDTFYTKAFTGSDKGGVEKEWDKVTFPMALTATDIPERYVRERTFLFGTDKYGRDLLSRMLVGTRISFSIGFIAVFISLVIGIFLGALGGYFGGKVDSIVMWLINVTWSIPTLLMVIAITLALGKGFWQVFIAVGLTMWVEVARVVRGQVLSAKQMQYVTAARALGLTDARIIRKHILPNIIAPVIVISAANFAAAILIESGLSFLGIGVQPPTPSWGGMIKDHYNYILLGKPYLAIIPGIAIMSLVTAFMLMGNALRDGLDVKSL